MKRIKTFEQYNTLDVLNEGFMNIVNKYSGKLKELVRSALAKFAPDQVAKLKQEIAQFKGMSVDQIKQELQSRSTTANESVGDKIFNFTGLAFFSTFIGSLGTMIADNKWDFLHKIFNAHDSVGLPSEGGYLLATMGISFAAFILWFLLKLEDNEESWADATRPSGTTPAERHSSGYIASQMKRNNR